MKGNEGSGLNLLLRFKLALGIYIKLENHDIWLQRRR
jgi:hypothetical protein